MTSAEASKLLKKLNEDYTALLLNESQSKDFVASVGENVDECRPEYDFKTMQAELADLEKKIRKVKHAISVFNLTTKVPGFDMTMDEMLIYIPQLSKKKMKLAEMKSKLKRERMKDGFGSTIIDYRYINYEVADAAAEYEAVATELAHAQTALDKVNSTESFEVEL